MGNRAVYSGGMSDPFARDGRLSESALRRIASEAAGARRHVGGGADNFYTTPGGAVQVPSSSTPSNSIYTVSNDSNYGFDVSLHDQWQPPIAARFYLVLPPGVYWITAMLSVAVQFETSPGAGGIVLARLQVDSGSASFLGYGSPGNLVSDNTQIVREAVNGLPLFGANFLQTLAVVKATAQITPYFLFSGTIDYLDLSASYPVGGGDSGSNIIAWQIPGAHYFFNGLKQF